MKTFLQHAKELEREELERQMHRHFEMAQKSLTTAQQLEMAGDMDGYKTFMAKHHHFQTQGDYLKNALNESFANDFLAMAKKRVPSAEIKSSEQRRKETDALMKQRQAAAANRPKQSSGGAGEKYPLGGYDAKSGRSYSEEVELDGAKDDYHYTDEKGNKYRYGASGYVGVVNKSGINQGQQHISSLSSVHKKNYEKLYGKQVKKEEVENVAEGSDSSTQSHADVFKSETDTMKPGTKKYVGRKDGREVHAKKDAQGNIKFYHRDGIKGPLKSVTEEVELDEVAAWQRKEGKNPTGGLNRKGIASYRRENPGSKLSMAVTTKPSKLKKGSKAWNRRKSFCARMGGMPGPMKDEKGRPTRKALSLRKWNC